MYVQTALSLVARLVWDLTNRPTTGMSEWGHDGLGLGWMATCFFACLQTQTCMHFDRHQMFTLHYAS